MTATDELEWIEASYPEPERAVDWRGHCDEPGCTETPPVTRWKASDAAVARLCACPDAMLPIEGDDVDTCFTCGDWRRSTSTHGIGPGLDYMSTIAPELSEAVRRHLAGG